MDIKKLYLLATYHFFSVRSNCAFLKITHFMEEGETFNFYGLFKCKRRVIVKKVILTKDGDLVAIISL